MAQIACQQNIEEVSDIKLIDDEDGGPPSKKLRQARLPFKPLDQKPQIISSTSPLNHKKRKLSDGESPSAKPPKSHKPVVEKPPPMVDHDPEVSSSSETENIPVRDVKVRIRNTLERFVRKNSQEEISSTNTDDCIDLTENFENDVTNDKSNAGKTATDDKKNQCMESNEAAGISTETDKRENNEQEPASSMAVISDDVQDEVVQSSKSENSETVKKVKEDEDAKTMKTESPKSDNNKNKSQKTPKRGIDAFVKKVDDKNLESTEEFDQVQEQSGKLSNDLDTDVDMEEEDEADEDDGSEDADDEEDSCINNCQQSPKTPARNKPNGDLTKTPVSEKPDSFKTPSRSPDGSTPTSAKQKRTLSAAKLKERDEVRQQREKEKEEKRLQKEQERLAKEKEKEEKKKQREEEKAEKERQRLEEKAEKERQKQEEKDKKEKERLEKLKQKEEERKKKQELLDAKNEEKKKKEEEKKQKEEEKMRELEEKQKKEQKVKEAFAGFFIPKTSPVSKPSKEVSGMFMPFEAKANMELAPALRRDELNENEKNHIDQSISKQDCTELYLDELKSMKINPKKAAKTPRIHGTDDDVILVHDKETVKKVTYHCKLLQFHENYRPPYYGTWRKKSKLLTPKNPLKQDENLFDYEIDSDDEWEEEEPGESLSASEGEDEKEEGADEDDEDGWMVPHGYLSDDEGCEEDEETTAESKSARQMAKEQAWEAELKRQACRLTPIIIGCLWESAVHSLQEQVEETLQNYKAVNLLDGPIPTSHSNSFVKDNQIDPFERPASATPKLGIKKPVPEEAMPDLIRMVHGNLAGIKKLVKEFRTFWDMKTGLKSVDKVEDISMEVDNDEKEASRKDEPKDESSSEKPGDTPVSETNIDNFSISKRQMEMKITSIAVREKREGFKKVCWYVNDNILQQFGLQELPVPSAWEFVTKPFKTPNKQKAEESPVTPVGRKTPTVSITQFARPMSPSAIAAQNAAIMANLKQQQSVKQPETKMETDSEQKDTSKTGTNDQRTIKQFTKKLTSPPGTPASSPVSSKKGNKLGMLVKPIAHNKPLGASPEMRKTLLRPSALSPAANDKNNEVKMSPVTGLQSKTAAFSPVDNNQSKVIVDLSQPNVVTVTGPNTKPVSREVNVIPPSMIRSNLKQSVKKGVTGPKGKNDNPITQVCAAESTASPKRIVPKPCALTSSSDDSKKQPSILSPIVSVLKQMGNNATEAIMID